MSTPASQPKSPLMPAPDYVRVEIRAGGVTYTYELEPGPNLPIESTVNVVAEMREVPRDGLSRRFEPDLRTAAIQVSGKLARADRRTPERSVCTCPDIDVSLPAEKPGTQTVKGFPDASCGLHGRTVSP